MEISKGTFSIKGIQIEAFKIVLIYIFERKKFGNPIKGLSSKVLMVFKFKIGQLSCRYVKCKIKWGHR